VTRLPQAIATLGLLAAVASGASCDRAAPAPDPVGPAVVALADEITTGFAVELDLALTYCTTSAGCATSIGDLVAPSLVTGLSCGLPEAWDGFLAFGRRVSCYDGGTLATPSTWTAVADPVDPAVDADEHVYSAVVASQQSAFANTTLMLEPLRSFVPAPADPVTHCLYEAEALVVATPSDASPRAVYHREHPARLNWRVVLEPTSGGAFDCHMSGSPALSEITKDTPASVTVSLPSETTKGTYPATFDYATLALADVVTGGTTHGAARVRYVLGADFPVLPTAARAWAERDLVVMDGATPLDAEIDSTCARVDPATGALEAIGVLLRDATDHGMHGAVEVFSNLDADRFECARSGGACVAIPWSGAGGAASCLLALEPVAFVTADTYAPGVAYDPDTSPNTFASRTDANAICAATQGTLPGTYVAWLSATGAHAKDAVSARGLRTSDGLRIAADLDALLAAGTTPLAHAIDRTAAGTAVTTALTVWTGTAADGTAAATRCSDWTSALGTDAGTVGSATATGAAWTADATLACDQAARLYCVRVPD